MPDTEKPIMWNGGTTNETKEKAIKDWNKMIRQSEDYLDGVAVSYTHLTLPTTSPV